MLKAAELAMYDSQNQNILLLTADEGASPRKPPKPPKSCWLMAWR